MVITTGLSGNEIYCLAEKKLKPGNIVLGNGVYSLGFVKSITSGLKAIAGGEIASVTEIIEQGRHIAYQRMLEEAQKSNASGITGVANQLVFHNNRIEFLSIGSEVTFQNAKSADFFLQVQMDKSFMPKLMRVINPNVLYSVTLLIQ